MGKAAKDSKKKRAIEEVFKKPEPTAAAGSSWHQPEPQPGPSSSDVVSVAGSSGSNGEPSVKKIKKSSNNFLDQKPKAGTSKKASGVQEDPGKSEIYKSLFSSHKSAQNKPTGHWITFDPRYN